MRISQLAERAGVPATTLRFYESAGLLPAGRTTAGYRLYGEDALQRLRFISSAKQLGLPLEQVAELLGVWESSACREVRADLRPRVTAQLADAQARATELAAFITMLRQALDHLDALPDRSDSCDPDCAFPAEDLPPERWRAAPVACSLTGPGTGERISDWQRILSGARRRVIPDGLCLVMPVGRTGQVAALAAEEQQCCPFFDFRLHLDGPDLVLEVRAPASAAAFLNDLFASPEGLR